MRKDKTLKPNVPGQILAQLPAVMAASIIGQPEVLQRLAAAVKRREYDACLPKGCREAFFFAGPTGVGKTETTRVLARHLFKTDCFVRFDCSEFKTPESVMALLGDRQGDPGRFSREYDRVPEGVWLFDEVEKAHRDLVQLFLQMTDAGRITPANGQTLDFSRIYIVVTSNLGSAEIIGREHLPFVSLEQHVVRSVKKHLRPELLARFDRPYVFRPLSRDVQSRIVTLHFGRLLDRQRQLGRFITTCPRAHELVLQKGFARDLGARPLLQTLNELVGNAIVAALEQGGTGSGHLMVSGNHLQLVP